MVRRREKRKNRKAKLNRGSKRRVIYLYILKNNYDRKIIRK